MPVLGGTTEVVPFPIHSMGAFRWLGFFWVLGTGYWVLLAACALEPQGLKPSSMPVLGGTTEVVPFPIHSSVGWHD